MIAALPPGQVAAVLRRTTLPAGGSWNMPRIAAAISDVQSRLLTDARRWRMPSQIVAGATAIFMAASQFVDPRAGRGALPCPCVALVDAWLHQFGLVLTEGGSPARRAEALEAARESLARLVIHKIAPDEHAITTVRSWLSEHMRCAETGASFAELQDASLTDPWPLGFLSCAITTLGFDELKAERQTATSVRSTLAGLGLDAYAPVLHDAVGLRRPDPSIGLVDEHALARSSLSIVVLRRPSVGLGYVLRFSAQCGIPILLLTDMPDLTPLARQHEGDDGLLQVFPLGADPEASVAAFVAHNWVRLARHASSLAAKAARWQAEQRRYVDELAALPIENVVAPSALELTRARFHTLLYDPYAWGRATRDEIEQLAALMPPPLATPETAALAQAGDEAHWTDGLRAKLEWLARCDEGAALATSGAAAAKRRVDRTQPAYWYRLRSRLL